MGKSESNLGKTFLKSLLIYLVIFLGLAGSIFSNEIVAVGTPLVKIEVDFRVLRELSWMHKNDQNISLLSTLMDRITDGRLEKIRYSTYLKVESSTRFTLLTAQVM